MKSWIWPDEKEIALLVALLMGYANWLALRPSLPFFNWEAVGWILFGLTLAYLAKGSQATIRQFRQNRVFRRITSSGFESSSLATGDQSSNWVVYRDASSLGLSQDGVALGVLLALFTHLVDSCFVDSFGKQTGKAEVF